MKRLLTASLLLALFVSGQAYAEEVLKTDPARYLDVPSFLGYVQDEFIVVLNDNATINHSRDLQSPIALSALSGFDDLSNRFQVNRIRPQFPGSDKGAMAASEQGEKLSRFYKVRFESGTLDDAMAAYAADPMVESVEPIGIHALYATPNDTYYDNPPPEFPYDQWHYWDTYGIDADLAWDSNTGDATVVVGILDTGVKYDHGDLGGSNPPGPNDVSTNGNIWVNNAEIPGNGVDDDGNGYTDDVIGWDFVDRTDWYSYACVDSDCGTADNDPFDHNGHGTHVAGTIAAISNNGYAVAGIGGGWGDGTFSGTVANGVKVVPCRIGYTLRYLNQDVGVVIMDYVAEGMYYMAELKIAGENVAAVNCSFGSSNTGGLGAACDYLIAQDVMVVVASGNDGSTSADYLGTRADCMDVGATDQSGNVASFSNYGTWVDIAAPGVSIMSTTTDPGDPTGDYIAPFDGTSMACPHVVGVAAMLEAYDPSLTAQDKWDLMVDNTNPYNGTHYVGPGIVNLKKAMDAAGPNMDPPVAAFVGSPTSGEVPVTVNFTDQSTNTPTSWSWNFGDGNTSTVQNPSHTYTVAGTYAVALTATNAYGSDTETKTDYVTFTAPATDPPVADFVGSPTSGEEALTVTFTDQSANAPTSWNWDFGDGGSSTAQNPQYTYNTAGTYTVSLTATNAFGFDTMVKTDYITVNEPQPSTKAYPLADIPVDGTVGGSYTNTYASDNSYESITEIAYTGHPRKTYSYLEHKWNFNVSGGSTITFYLEAYRTNNAEGDNFVFAYSTDGATYTNLVTVASATEQVYSAALPNTISGTVYIRVLDTDRNWGNTATDAVFVDEMYIEYSSQPMPPVAAFSGSPTSGYVPLAVQFTDLSSNGPTSWSWNFGDGNTSTAQSPQHTYAAIGTYTVSLTATNAYGSDTDTKTGYITVTDEPVGGTMHVENMVVGRSKSGPNYYGTSTVTIFDATSQPVGGATVYVTATGPTGGSYSGVTATNGTVSFQTASGAKRPPGEWCFEVTNVTHGTFSYDAGANAVTYACESGWVSGSGSDLWALDAMPTTYGLSQNYPNPFNPTTEIAFSLPEASSVTLEVFNVVGQRVAILAEGSYGAGNHIVTWDASSQSSGVYFYRLSTDTMVDTKKMLLLK